MVLVMPFLRVLLFLRIHGQCRSYLGQVGDLRVVVAECSLLALVVGLQEGVGVQVVCCRSADAMR